MRMRSSSHAKGAPVTANLFPPENLFPQNKFASGNVPRLANLFPGLYNIPSSKRPGKRAGEALYRDCQAINHGQKKREKL